MKEEQQPESNAEKKTPEPDLTSGASDAKESRRKRQTIRIRIPRKPAAPRRVTRAPMSAVVRPPHAEEPARAKDTPLRITCFVIVILMALAYCDFFFEFVRFVPLRDDLPRILWPQVIRKLLGISLLVGFGLFERTGKELPSRSRWMYCLLLAFGTAFFAAQWIIRF